MKSFAVIGCGRFGGSVARTLHGLGHEVLAIDLSEDIIREIADEVTYAVQADVMDESVLTELGLSNFDVVVVGIGTDIEASIMATLVVKELGVKRIIAKALSDLHGKVLTKIGADSIVFPERDMGARVAHNLTSKSVLDFIELSPEHSILEIKTLKKWENHTLAELKISKKYGINIITIKRGDDLIVSPTGDEVIKQDDVLVVIGNIENIKRLEHNAGE